MVVPLDQFTLRSGRRQSRLCLAGHIFEWSRDGGHPAAASDGRWCLPLNTPQRPPSRAMVAEAAEALRPPLTAIDKGEIDADDPKARALAGWKERRLWLPMSCGICFGRRWCQSIGGPQCRTGLYGAVPVGGVFTMTAEHGRVTGLDGLATDHFSRVDGPPRPVPGRPDHRARGKRANVLYSGPSLASSDCTRSK